MQLLNINTFHICEISSLYSSKEVLDEDSFADSESLSNKALSRVYFAFFAVNVSRSKDFFCGIKNLRYK